MSCLRKALKACRWLVAQCMNVVCGLFVLVVFVGHILGVRQDLAYNTSSSAKGVLTMIILRVVGYSFEEFRSGTKQMFDELLRPAPELGQKARGRKVVLSVKYDANRNWSRNAHLAARMLGACAYNPNTVTFSVCHRAAQRLKDFKNTALGCGGREDKCVKHHNFNPPSNATCWCSAFHWQLEQPRAIMLRILEDHKLGDGQVIEAEMQIEVRVPFVQIQARGISAEKEKLNECMMFAFMVVLMYITGCLVEVGPMRAYIFLSIPRELAQLWFRWKAESSNLTLLGCLLLEMVPPLVSGLGGTGLFREMTEREWIKSTWADLWTTDAELWVSHIALASVVAFVLVSRTLHTFSAFLSDQQARDIQQELERIGFLRTRTPVQPRVVEFATNFKWVIVRISRHMNVHQLVLLTCRACRLLPPVKFDKLPQTFANDAILVLAEIITQISNFDFAQQRLSMALAAVSLVTRSGSLSALARLIGVGAVFSLVLFISLQICLKTIHDAMERSVNRRK